MASRGRRRQVEKPMLEQIFRPVVWLLSINPLLDAVFALVVGIALIFGRGGHRGLYGFAEVLFGMSVAGLAVIRISPADFDALDFSSANAVTVGIEVSLLQFFTAVFIVVRGLDNIRQWMDDPSPA
jgi:hypothetical protein